MLPPVLQKSGELRKDAKALTLPQMKALMEHARQTAAALAQEMMDGKTDICPGTGRRTGLLQPVRLPERTPF